MAPKSRSTTKRSSVRAVPKPQQQGNTGAVAAELMGQLQPLIQQAVADAVAKALPVQDIADSIDDDSDADVTFPNVTPARAQGEDYINPLCLHVSPANIARIQANLFVPLGELINDTDKDLSLNISNNGQVTVNNKVKAVKITSMEQWFSAFCIYSAIYAEQRPGESAQLFIYMARIQGIGKTFGLEGAVQYDECFRRLRERQPDCRWDVIHPEMYLIAASKSAINKPPQPRSTSQQPFRRNNPCPTGYCRQFNAKGQCAWPQCLYKHACFKCEGKHASTTCSKVMQSSTERPLKAAVAK